MGLFEHCSRCPANFLHTMVAEERGVSRGQLRAAGFSLDNCSNEITAEVPCQAVGGYLGLRLESFEVERVLRKGGWVKGDDLRSAILRYVYFQGSLPPTDCRAGVVKGEGCALAELDFAREK